MYGSEQGLNGSSLCLRCTCDVVLQIVSRCMKPVCCSGPGQCQQHKIRSHRRHVSVQHFTGAGPDLLVLAMSDVLAGFTLRSALCKLFQCQHKQHKHFDSDTSSHLEIELLEEYIKRVRVYLNMFMFLVFATLRTILIVRTLVLHRHEFFPRNYVGPHSGTSNMFWS